MYAPHAPTISFCFGNQYSREHFELTKLFLSLIREVAGLSFCVLKLGELSQAKYPCELCKKHAIP